MPLVGARSKPPTQSMPQADPAKKFTERKQHLLLHLIEVSGQLQVDLAYAFEQFYGDRVYTYFSIEEKLQAFDQLLQRIREQMDQATTLTELNQIFDRISYVEDRIDEAESALYRRSGRRRKRSFSSFFTRFTQGNGSDPSQQEIASTADAHQILGVKEGATLVEVTAAFRQRVKEYHPDARGGDRSGESHLREVVSAYQLLKDIAPRDVTA